MCVDDVVDVVGVLVVLQVAEEPSGADPQALTTSVCAAQMVSLAQELSQLLHELKLRACGVEASPELASTRLALASEDS